MFPDLTALLQDKVGQTLTRYATEQLQESPAASLKAVAMTLPALLGELAKNHANDTKMTALFNLVTGPRLADSSLEQLPSPEMGGHLLTSTLGDTAWLNSLIANKSGVSSSNASNLLATAFPLILGVLRSHIQTNNLTQPQFVALLASQKSFLDNLLSGGFLGNMGMGAGLGAEAATTTGNNANKAMPTTATPNGNSIPKWLWFAAVGLITASLATFCSDKKPTPESAPSDTPASHPAAANVLPVPETTAQSASASAIAASDTNLNAVADTTDADAASPAVAAASTPISMQDGGVKYENGILSVYFATGKTDFDTASAEALATDIVQQGKKGKVLAVSGFHDPRGNARLNAELSKKRAQAVRHFLITQGVPEAHIELVKPSDTTEHADSNAENRRVDVRVQ